MAKYMRRTHAKLPTIIMQLASCLINAQPLPAHRPATDDNEMSCCQVVVWVHSYIEIDYVPFDNTTPIYLINLLWKLGLGLGLDLQLHYFRIFRREQRKRAPYLPRTLRKVTSC